MRNYFYSFILFLHLISQAFAMEGALEKLPEDMLLQPEVVHKIKYNWAKSNDLAIHFTNLYGDKFLNTMGVTLTDTFYFTENLGVRASFSYFSRSITDDARVLSSKGLEPAMSDPSWLAGLSVLYQPLYGKVIVGSRVQRFKCGLHLGAHLTSETPEMLRFMSRYKTLVLGPTLGTELVLPLSNHFSAKLSCEFMLHNTNAYDAPDELKKLWALSLGVAWRI